MVEWRYGDAGDRWPVAPGEVWRAGPHLMACGDIEQPESIVWINGSPAPAMVYVDPPWGAGNARSFRTKAGVGRPVDFDTFLGHLFDAVSRTTGPIFMEMGNAHTSRLVLAAQQRGLSILDHWAITYYGKHPCSLFAFVKRDSLLTPRAGFTGLDDEETPAAAISLYSQRGDLVLDPCTGRGLTALSADAHGRRFLGLELHPRRLAVTLDALHHQSGHQPERAGNLSTWQWT